MRYGGGNRMKKYFLIIICTISVVGCKSTKIPQYKELITNEQFATLEIVANLKGIFLHGKTTQLEIFDGCYKESYQDENVLGHVISEHSDRASNIIKIPSGKRIYLQLGTTEHAWNCHVQLSFLPIRQAHYKLQYDMILNGCEVKLTTLNAMVVDDLLFYESLPGRTDDWRKCD